MENVKNETTNTLNSSVSKSAFDYAGSHLKLSDLYKNEIVDLNAEAMSLGTASIKVRDITYRFVSKLCDASYKMVQDDDYMVAVQNVSDTLLIKRTSDAPSGTAITQPNPFLNLVRIADGQWIETFNKVGNKVVTWVPNRSSEKYASVCRFATRNGYSGADMLAHFTSGEDFKIPTPSGHKLVKATINAVIAEDKIQHQAAERKIMSPEDWRDVLSLKPLATIPLTKRLTKALSFTLSEGGLGVVSIRVEGDQILLLGAAGIENGNAVLRQFKSRASELRKAYLEAVSLPDEPDFLGEEYEVTM